LRNPFAPRRSCCSSASNSQERDPFIGDYGGDCGPDVQCWVEVEKAGKDYRASFIAADRMDASKVLCRLDSHMDREHKFWLKTPEQIANWKPLPGLLESAFTVSHS